MATAQYFRNKANNDDEICQAHIKQVEIKVAATDKRYLARSKFSRRLVHKK